MNLAGTVNIAFISIALGPIAKKNRQKAQQNKLDQNKAPEKALGSPD